MTVQTYGPKILPVLPASASEVKVTRPDGSVPTFTTPVTVDPTTHAVSFALDDGGAPVHLIIRVQKASGGGSTTVRVTLPEPTAPAAEFDAGVTLAAAPGGAAVNGVRSYVLIEPSDAVPGSNAITVKRTGHAPAGWGNKNAPYGGGQVFELMSDSATDASQQTDPTNPVLFRIDAFGGIGVCHGAHIATGLRAQSDGVTPTQSIWVDPSIDCVGMILDNPTPTEVPATPAASFMLIRDVRPTTAYTLLEVKADGTLNSNKALVAGSRLAGDIPLLVKPVAGSTALAFQVNDNAGAKRFVVSSLGTMAGNADDGVTNAYTFAANNLGNAGYRAILQAVNAAVHVMALTSPAAYTGDHLQVVPSGGVKFRVNKAGYPVGKLNAAPALADLSDGEYALWLDTAGNAFKISARIAGVLRTGTVAVA